MATRAHVTAPAQQRSFGLIVGSGFAVIALWPMVVRGDDVRVWALAVSVVLLTMALVVPRGLKPFHRAWMTVGEALGWVNTRIILSVVYYVVIVPIAAIRRMSGNDPMRRTWDRGATTYRVPRSERPASHMQRQY